MKTKIYFLVGVVVCIFLVQPQVTQAQWSINPITGNAFFQPDYLTYPNVESFGIGDFAAGGFAPNSALEINTNYIPVNPEGYLTLGEVFRTDCPTDISTYWRMLRGGVEYGRAYNLATDDGGEIHWNLGAPEGELRFHANKQAVPDAGSYQERMRVSSGIGFDGEIDVTKISIHYQAPQKSTIET